MPSPPPHIPSIKPSPRPSFLPGFLPAARPGLPGRTIRPNRAAPNARHAPLPT
ncbi:hypothetical protein NicSoilC5_26510 [Arthrobacter sp. NicSoilC5]|nr:hypothetical protein NicSoilC5_26510 [Arthrobacter sp. NicSoilC5]